MKLQEYKDTAKSLAAQFESSADLCARIDALDNERTAQYVCELLQCAVSFDACVIRHTMLVVAQRNVMSFKATDIQSLSLRSVTKADTVARYTINAAIALDLMTADAYSRKAECTYSFNANSEVFKALCECASYYLEDDTLQDTNEVCDVMRTADALNLK